MLLDCDTYEEMLTIISSTYCGAKVFMSTYTQGGVIMWRSSAYSAAIVCGLKRQLRASVEHAHSEVASISEAERRKYAIPLSAINLRHESMPTACSSVLSVGL